MNKQRIILVSDNHTDQRTLALIAHNHPEANYYLHCGDSELDNFYIKPFLSVLGNNDFDHAFKKEIIMEIGNKKILMLHGNGYISMFSNNRLLEYAKEKKVDIVFFGHTHIFNYSIEDDIIFINPGSCVLPRDGSPASYAEIIIDQDEVRVYRHNIIDGKIKQ